MEMKKSVVFIIAAVSVLSLALNVVLLFFLVDGSVTRTYTGDELERRTSQRDGALLVCNQALVDDTRGGLLSTIDGAQPTESGDGDPVYFSELFLQFENDRLIRICLPYEESQFSCESEGADADPWSG